MTPLEELAERYRREGERLDRELERNWRTLRWMFPLGLVGLLVLVVLPFLC